MTNKTVIIVGAGATIAEAGRQTKANKPPSDTTFFELCRAGRLPGKKPIIRYMQDAYGLDPFVDNLRMEEVFNYIYSDTFSGATSDECLSAYWSLLGLYRIAISKTTNNLNGSSRYGVGQLLRALYEKELSRDVKFITFNQDLLIEKAIEHTMSFAKYSDVEWNIKDTYRVKFQRVLEANKDKNTFVNKGPSNIDILKLHGSLNWAYRVRSGEDPKNSIRTPGKQLLLLNEHNVHSRAQDHSTARVTDMLPLVVPPIYEKSAVYRNIIGPIWTAAEKSIEEADEIIIFGYSFPDTDYAAKSILKRAFHKNKRVNQLTIIDKSPEIAGKITGLLSAPSSIYHQNVPEFKRLYLA